MRGRRVPDVGEPGQPHPIMERGDYRRVQGPDGWEWHVCTPNGMRGNLANHEVIEHEDGTITVSPSILCDWPNRTRPKRYHGFLRNGVWETLGDTDPMPGKNPEA